MATPALTTTTNDENHLAGILWMLLTMCLFVLMDTFAKSLSEHFSPFQAVWARFFFHMFFLTLILRRALWITFASGDVKLQLLRSTLLMTTTLLFFSGLRTTELSTATAIMFLSPIFVTVLAIPLLGERVGLRRFIGVLIGFVGALIIVHPRTGVGVVVEGVDTIRRSWQTLIPESGHLLLICAALSNALYQILTRKLRLLDAPMTTLLYSGVVGVIVMSLWAPRVWLVPGPTDWIMMMCLGLLGCVSHFCLIRSFRHAPASLVVPFSYSALLWATLLGYFVFNALPDRWTLAGAALIISSGLYIFYRERSISNNT